MKAAPFDAIVFDLDGTLWDSSSVCAEAWSHALRIADVNTPPITEADVARVMGLPADKLFTELLPKLDKAKREKVDHLGYAELISRLAVQSAPLYDGVPEALTKIAKQYPLFLVSNCRADYLSLFFQVPEMRALFRDALCYGMTGRPKSENIRRICEKHQVKAGAYVGDTASDQRAAEEAGLTFLHADWGFGVPEREALQFRTINDLATFLLPKTSTA